MPEVAQQLASKYRISAEELELDTKVWALPCWERPIDHWAYEPRLLHTTPRQPPHRSSIIVRRVTSKARCDSRLHEEAVRRTFAKFATASTMEEVP